jgi:flagellar hook-length control protein FliK
MKKVFRLYFVLAAGSCMGSLLVSLFTPQASADVANAAGFSNVNGAVASDTGNQNQPQLFDVLIAQQTAQNLKQTLAQAQRAAANAAIQSSGAVQDFPVDPSQEEAWLQTTGQEVIATPLDDIEQVDGSQVAMISVMPPVQPMVQEVQPDTDTVALGLGDGDTDTPSAVVDNAALFKNAALHQSAADDTVVSSLATLHDTTLDATPLAEGLGVDTLSGAQGQVAVVSGADSTEDAGGTPQDTAGLSLEKQAVDAVVKKAKKATHKKEDGQSDPVTGIEQAARNDAPLDGQTNIQATLANAPATLEQQGQKMLQMTQGERKASEQAVEISGAAALLGTPKQVEKNADGQFSADNATTGKALPSTSPLHATNAVADTTQQSTSHAGKDVAANVAPHNSGASGVDFNAMVSASELDGNASALDDDAAIGDAPQGDNTSFIPTNSQQSLSVSHRDHETLTHVHLQRGVMAHASIHEQIQVHVQQGIQQGDSDAIQIELHPLELGSIKVSLEVAADNATQVIVTADRQETLDMLQRDAKGLAKALAEAGLQADASNLQFNMSGDGRSGGEAQAQKDAFGTDFESSKGSNELKGDVVGNVEASAASQAGNNTMSYTASLTQGLDISV